MYPKNLSIKIRWFEERNTRVFIYFKSERKENTLSTILSNRGKVNMNSIFRTYAHNTVVAPCRESELITITAKDFAGSNVTIFVYYD